MQFNERPGKDSERSCLYSESAHVEISKCCFNEISTNSIGILSAKKASAEINSTFLTNVRAKGLDHIYKPYTYNVNYSHTYVNFIACNEIDNFQDEFRYVRFKNFGNPDVKITTGSYLSFYNGTADDFYLASLDHSVFLKASVNYFISLYDTKPVLIENTFTNMKFTLGFLVYASGSYTESATENPVNYSKNIKDIAISAERILCYLTKISNYSLTSKNMSITLDPLVMYPKTEIVDCIFSCSGVVTAPAILIYRSDTTRIESCSFMNISSAARSEYNGASAFLLEYCTNSIVSKTCCSGCDGLMVASYRQCRSLFFNESIVFSSKSQKSLCFNSVKVNFYGNNVSHCRSTLSFMEHTWTLSDRVDFQINYCNF